MSAFISAFSSEKSERRLNASAGNRQGLMELNRAFDQGLVSPLIKQNEWTFADNNLRESAASAPSAGKPQGEPPTK
jgi:hypothetical protein